jgi:hypothetical protein
MNLSERLERAKLERDLAAGRVTSSAALRPDPVEVRPPEAQPPLFDPISIEVGPIGLASVVDESPAPPSASLFGTTQTDVDPSNSRCPTCNRIGRVDMVDLVGHRTHLTCDGCGAMWNVFDPSTV